MSDLLAWCSVFVVLAGRAGGGFTKEGHFDSRSNCPNHSPNGTKPQLFAVLDKIILERFYIPVIFTEELVYLLIRILNRQDYLIRY